MFNSTTRGAKETQDRQQEMKKKKNTVNNVIID